MKYETKQALYSYHNPDISSTFSDLVKTLAVLIKEPLWEIGGHISSINNKYIKL